MARPPTPWYKKLHWQIIAGLLLGVVFGVAAAANGWGGSVADWVAPWIIGGIG